MNEIQKIEKEIMELSAKLTALRKNTPATPVKNYEFDTQTGKVSLLDLFGSREILFAIHNMGQGCRYCTLWADGLNPFVEHLEDRFAVVVLSKDTPELQRQIANDRNWRFKMASHGGGDYIREQSVITSSESNIPGIVCYEKKGNQIFRKSSSIFGPNDQYCSFWHILSLAGFSEADVTPQFSYWKKPQQTQMEDGGKNLL